MSLMFQQLTRLTRTEIWESTKALFHLIWPTYLTLVVSFAMPLTSTLFVGHLGEKYLAAASLGTMIVNASGLSIAIGLSMGLDTLCTQAFGAKKYKLVGLFTQRAMVILTLSCFPIVALWMFTEKILIFGNVDPEIAALSQHWVYWQIIALWPILMYESFKRYLIAQSITLPQTVGVGMSTAIHILDCYLLVHVFDLGFTGAAIAAPITEWTCLLVTIVTYLIFLKYKRGHPQEGLDEDHDLKVVKSEDQIQELEFASSDGSTDSDSNEDGQLLENNQKSQPINASSTIPAEFADIPADLMEAKDAYDTWPRLSMNIFKGWIGYLKLGVPAALSLFIEWGSFEVNAMIIAQTTNSTANSAPLATHAILSNTASLWYMPAASIATAATTLIGNALGAKEPEKAVGYVVVSGTLAVCLAFLNGGLAITYKDYWGKIWTSEPEVVAMTSYCMWVMWFYTVWDSLKCIGIGVLRGAGKYNITVITNAVSCILIGWPLSYLIGVHFQKSTFGVWWGMSCAWIVASCVYVVVLARIDWDQETIESEKRTNEGLDSATNER